MLFSLLETTYLLNKPLFVRNRASRLFNHIDDVGESNWNSV